jgi:hypothetical protein
LRSPVVIKLVDQQLAEHFGCGHDSRPWRWESES